MKEESERLVDKSKVEEIYQFNMDLSFPRRNDGSEGHQKAIDLIENTLKDEEIEYKEQDFYWLNLRKRRKFTQKLPILILSIRILIGLTMTFFQDHMIIPLNGWYVWLVDPRWVMIIAAIALLIFFISIYSDCVKPNLVRLWKINNFVKEGKLDKRHYNEGKNIVVKFGKDGLTSEANTNNTPILIVLAHYDSISVKFKPALQNLLYARIGTVAFSSIVTIIIIPLYMYFGLFSWWMILLVVLDILFTLFSVFAYVVSYFNPLTNESEGAFDNASGCATMYGVIKELKDQDLNADVRFVFADCEEEGLMGTIMYMNEVFDGLNKPENKPRVKVLSLDGTGGKPKLALMSSYGVPRIIRCGKNLKSEFKEIASDLFDMDIKSLWAPYASSDHAVFGEFGFDAIQLFSVGMVSNTKYDTKDNVQKDTLGMTTEFVIEWILRNSDRRIAI